MIVFWVYLAETVFPAIGFVGSSLLGLSFVLAVVYVSVGLFDDSDYEKFSTRFNRQTHYSLMVGFFAASCILSFIPSSRDTGYHLLAAYGVQTAIDDPQVQQAAGKSFQILDKILDDYLQEQSKPKENKTPEKSTEKSHENSATDAATAAAATEFANRVIDILQEKQKQSARGN